MLRGALRVRGQARPCPVAGPRTSASRDGCRKRPLLPQSTNHSNTSSGCVQRPLRAQLPGETHNQKYKPTQCRLACRLALRHARPALGVRLRLGSPPGPERRRLATDKVTSAVLVRHHTRLLHSSAVQAAQRPQSVRRPAFITSCDEATRKAVHQLSQHGLHMLRKLMHSCTCGAACAG